MHHAQSVVSLRQMSKHADACTLMDGSEAGQCVSDEVLCLCRRTHAELRRSSFVHAGAIAWHGQLPNEPDWTEESRLVAYTLSNSTGGGLYIAFNTSHLPQVVQLPSWANRTWQLISDSGQVRPLHWCPLATSSEQRVTLHRRRMMKQGLLISAALMCWGDGGRPVLAGGAELRTRHQGAPDSMLWHVLEGSYSEQHCLEHLCDRNVLLVIHFGGPWRTLSNIWLNYSFSNTCKMRVSDGPHTFGLHKSVSTEVTLQL